MDIIWNLINTFFFYKLLKDLHALRIQKTVNGEIKVQL